MCASPSARTSEYAAEKGTSGAARETDHKIEELFRMMDVAGRGRLDKPELVEGMKYYNGISLKTETIVLLAGMYGSEATGGLTLEDFKRLHHTLMTWSSLFRRHDVDSQEYLLHHSLCSALHELGYKLDRTTTRSLTRKLGRQAKYIQEDAFVRICCLLRRLSTAFKKKDLNRQKNIQLSYYEVLHMALDSCF
ncbi:peflin-like [Galendromus occidentalis]|uniref:Peflin-like n=1 Tax=Galendromus occidentalis TaxID=34638 RepID=A0AAJ6VUI8_9ACAR|nr:peflin-like [Galendromus occidentalis]